MIVGSPFWQPRDIKLFFFLISDERCVNEIASIFFLLYLCQNTGQSQVLISRKRVQNGLSLVQVKITYLIYSETYLVFNLSRYKDQYLNNQNMKIDSNFKVVYLQLSWKMKSSFRTSLIFVLTCRNKVSYFHLNFKNVKVFLYNLMLLFINL